MKPPAELSELFRARGLKVTPQRLRIFEELYANASHPSAESVYEAVSGDLPSISLRTVYQTLNDLAAMGELTQLELATGSSRFDPNLDPHHHLVCERCGRVHDVYADFTDVAVPAGHDHGFRVSATEIVFRGLCPACQATDADGPADPMHLSNPSIHHTKGGADAHA